MNFSEINLLSNWFNMPLYIWYENDSFTISSDHEEAPIWAQIIIASKTRVEEVMKKYSDNPNKIIEEYPAICEGVKMKVLSRVNKILDNWDMPDINWSEGMV